MGFTYQMMQFQEERLWAAASIGAGPEQLHPCDRRLRAQSASCSAATLADQQCVQFKLAEMKTDVEALRALHLPRLRAVRGRAGRDRAGLDVPS